MGAVPRLRNLKANEIVAAALVDGTLFLKRSDYSTIVYEPDTGAPIVQTAAFLASTNPLLAVGRLGYATDTKVAKIGDGVTLWNDLSQVVSLPASQRASTTAITSGIVNAAVDLNGLATINFTVTAGLPWEVEGFVSYCNPVGGARTGQLRICDEINAPKAYGYNNGSAAGMFFPLRAVEKITTPGTYQRKLQILAPSGAGTSLTILAATAGIEAFIEAKPVP